MYKMKKIANWDNEMLHYHLKEIGLILSKYNLEAEMKVYEDVHVDDPESQGA